MELSGIDSPTAVSLLQLSTTTLYSFFSQHLPHFDGQILHRERLLDEVHALVQHALVGDDVGGVAGHEQAFDARDRGIAAVPPGPGRSFRA